MIKRIDVAVFETVESVQQGKWNGGIREVGLADGALDYVYDENNKVWITDEIRAKVEALRAEILAGRITVPTR
jgi:basic membrane protein A